MDQKNLALALVLLMVSMLGLALVVYTWPDSTPRESQIVNIDRAPGGETLIDPLPDETAAVVPNQPVISQGPLGGGEEPMQVDLSVRAMAKAYKLSTTDLLDRLGIQPDLVDLDKSALMQFRENGLTLDEVYAQLDGVQWEAKVVE